MRGNIVAVWLSLLMVVPASAGVALAEDDAEPKIYDSVQTAVDEAEEGQTVLVSAQEDTVISESVTIDTPGLTVCSVPHPTDSSRDMTVRVVDDAKLCGDSSQLRETTIIDASDTNGVSPNVIRIEADDVTVQGFTLRWTVQLEEDVLGNDGEPDPTGTLLPSPGDLDEVVQSTQAGLSGVVVAGDNAELSDNTIQLRSGPCAEGVSPCESPLPATGVFLLQDTNGALVADNLIEVSPTPTDGTVSGDRGIWVSAEDYTITGNEIRFWARSGVFVSQNVDGAGEISGNKIVDNARYGIEVQDVGAEAAPTIAGNTFHLQGVADVLLNDGAGTEIVDDNAFRNLNSASTGIRILGTDDVHIECNTFANPDVTRNVAQPKPGTALTVSSGFDRANPTGLTVTHNDFHLAPGGLNQYAITVTSDVQDTTIDAELNFWDVDTWGDVNSRALDLGITNDIDQQPFRTDSSFNDDGPCEP